jgi:hypothetical protein
MNDGQMDYGHAVPLGIYTATQVRNILAGSRQLLVDNGILAKAADCDSFRAGGWMGANSVLDGLAAVGPEPFTTDSSAACGTYSAKLAREHPGFPLDTWLAEMYGSSEVTEPVYKANGRMHTAYPGGVVGLDPGDTSISQNAMIGGVTEVPNTGMMADYVGIADWKRYIDLGFTQAGDTGSVYLCIGFHQETATHTSDISGEVNIEIVRGAVDYYRSRGGAHFVTRRDMARLYRAEVEARTAARRGKPFRAA